MAFKTNSTTVDAEVTDDPPNSYSYLCSYSNL